MAIKYDATALLILFGSSPKMIDQQAKIFSYEVESPDGFKLNFYLSYYEKFIIARLKSKKSTVYEVSIEDVETLEIEENKIKIFRKDEDFPIIQIMVAPYFTDESSLFTLDARL